MMIADSCTSLLGEGTGTELYPMDTLTQVMVTLECMKRLCQPFHVTLSVLTIHFFGLITLMRASNKLSNG